MSGAFGAVAVAAFDIGGDNGGTGGTTTKDSDDRLERAMLTETEDCWFRRDGRLSGAIE